jgi:hypothetical protein
VSDIGLNLDGVITFLVAGVLCLLLLIALAACSLVARVANRRHAAVPHLVGILSSLAGSVVILVTVVMATVHSEERLEPNRAGVWFDGWLFLWAPAVLALWPIGALLYRRRQHAAGKGKKEDAG